MYLYFSLQLNEIFFSTVLYSQWGQPSKQADPETMTFLRNGCVLGPPWEVGRYGRSGLTTYYYLGPTTALLGLSVGEPSTDTPKRC